MKFHIERIEHISVSLDQNGIGTGYCLFREMNGRKLSSTLDDYVGDFSRGTWWVSSPNGGFHIFLKKEDAAQYWVESNDDIIIEKIHFKEIIRTGFYGNKAIVEVKRIYIVPKNPGFFWELLMYFKPWNPNK